MKYKIFFSVILSAMLFTACNSGSPADNPADNTPADVPSAEREIQTEREILYAGGRVALVCFSTDKLLVLDPKE